MSFELEDLEDEYDQLTMRRIEEIEYLRRVQITWSEQMHVARWRHAVSRQRKKVRYHSFSSLAEYNSGEFTHIL